MNKGYQMYVGDSKLTKTNDCNECFVVKIDNPEGASAYYYDFLNNGFLVPDYSSWEKEAFPLIVLFSEESGEWNYLNDDSVSVMKTAIKLFKKN